MSMRLVSAALAIALLGAATPTRAETIVSIAPQGDVQTFWFRGAKERDAMYRALAQELQKVAGKSLTGGETLKVTLADLRPAGRIDLLGRSDLRVLSGATPPSLKLRYALTRRGRVVARGEETVTDLSYLENVSARSSLASFPYERELIRDWFRRRIAQTLPPSR